MFRVTAAYVAEAEKADQNGKGWPCFGGSGLGSMFSSFLTSPWLSSWAPGRGKDVSPPGYGIPFKKGEKLVLQVHYNLLAANGGKVDAVVSANDTNAASAIAILDKNNLKVPVSGQDASVEGLTNVLSGKQCMTVFKDYLVEASTAAELAIAILKGETPTTNKQLADGTPFQAADPQALYADAASLDGFKAALDRIGKTAADVCTGDAAAKCTEIGLS